jgi:metal-responsive CopG/Arc/MetJ family transcriptional regulator
MKRNNRDIKLVLDEKLLNTIDLAASQKYMTRAEFIRGACVQRLEHFGVEHLRSGDGQT